MEFRLAEKKDLPEIIRVYEIAREYMVKTGNPTQWKDGYPLPALLEEDIELKQLYVVVEQEKIAGAFVFALGDDPTYSKMEGDSWKCNEPYGTIHRIGSDGTVKGIFKATLDFCKTICPYIRCDTHEDNKTMQHLMLKYGFEKRGIIICADGTPRIAFEYIP